MLSYAFTILLAIFGIISKMVSLIGLIAVAATSSAPVKLVLSCAVPSITLFFIGELVENFEDKFPSKLFLTFSIPILYLPSPSIYIESKTDKKLLIIYLLLTDINGIFIPFFAGLQNRPVSRFFSQNNYYPNSSSIKKHINYTKYIIKIKVLCNIFLMLFV